jgi:hypothetical protein
LPGRKKVFDEDAKSMTQTAWRKEAAGWAVLGAAILSLACDRPAAPHFTGTWAYAENGESAELRLEHDTATGRVVGTFVALGKETPISGRADASALVVEQVGDVVASADNGTMAGVISGNQVILTISQPGQDPVILPLTRQPGSGSRSTALTPGSMPGAGSDKTPTEPPPPQDTFTPGGPEAFAGLWEAVSDDGTSIETAELEISGQIVTGAIRSAERGYFSGRVTVNAEVSIRGTPRAGGLDLRAWNTQNGSAESAVTGRAVRRGEYLILRIGDGETGYARPGTPIVQSAEGSAEASALAQAVAGRIYSASTQASGRGAFVGNRVRLALCADGSIDFSVSDLASTGGTEGVDMGNATSRRGQWSVVLLTGTPVIRAQWTGTGSSYSLTRYFRVQPSDDGSRARVDGTELPATGSC